MRVVTIFGGPGTGKTHRLAELFSEAVKKYGVENVAFVSYTRTQVAHGRSMAGRMANVKRKNLKKFKTIHSTSKCGYGDLEAEVLDGETIEKMSLFLDRDMQSVARGIDYMRNTMTDDDAVGANRAGTDVKDFQISKRFYEKVKEGKSAAGAKVVDFSDMVKDAVDDGYKVDCKVAFVDEAQDLSPLQWRAVYTFFRGVDTLYVAGDPNQALFRFSGGNSNYMIHMRCDETVFLDRSRRCSESVFLLASRVWSRLNDRVDMPEPKDGEKGFAVFYPERDLCERFLNPIKKLLQDKKSVLVLANTYYQLKHLKDVLFKNESLPYDFLSGKFKHRNKNRKESLVVFSTVHQAKGTEADFVLYDSSCGDVGRFSDFGNESEKWQDYWRIAYTAMTRARDKLVVCQLSPSRSGEPSCANVIYYDRFGFEDFKKFCLLKPSETPSLPPVQYKKKKVVIKVRRKPRSSSPFSSRGNTR